MADVKRREDRYKASCDKFDKHFDEQKEMLLKCKCKVCSKARGMMDKAVAAPMSRSNGRSGELTLAQRKTLFIGVLAVFGYGEEYMIQDDFSESEMKAHNPEHFHKSKALMPLKVGASEVVEMFKRMKKEKICVPVHEDERERNIICKLCDAFNAECLA